MTASTIPYLRTAFFVPFHLDALEKRMVSCRNAETLTEESA